MRRWIVIAAACLASVAWSAQTDNQKNEKATSAKSDQASYHKDMSQAAKPTSSAASAVIVKNVTEASASKQHQHEPSENWTDVFRYAPGFLVENWDKVLASIFSGLLTWFTYLLWRSTHNLWKETRDASATAKTAAEAARTSADALKLAERAYLKVTPCSPGIRFESHPTFKDFNGRPGTVMACTWQMTNNGSTPAHITATVLALDVLAADKKPISPPDYSKNVDQEFAGAFLVKDASIFMSHSQINTDYHLANVDADAIRKGDKSLHLYGFVDYMDVFGFRRRRGFAYTYDPSLDDPAKYGPGMSIPEYGRRLNLSFMNVDGYDYDRRRKEGEGRDWGEKLQP